MITFIGFVGTGCEIEFEKIGQTEKAYQVETLDGVKMWLPKSAFEDDGVLNEYGCSLFHNKYSEGMGE